MLLRPVEIDGESLAPAILPVRSAETYLVLERLAARSAREPLCVVSLEIVWMRCRIPTCSGNLFWLHPAVLDKSTVRIPIRAVRLGAPHDRRNLVDDIAKLRLLPSDHRFSTTLLRDIGNRAHDFEIPGAIARSVSGHADMFDRTAG